MRCAVNQRDAGEGDLQVQMEVVQRISRCIVLRFDDLTMDSHWAICPVKM